MEARELGPDDPGYPNMLLDLERPPTLWWQGCEPPSYERAVAIIGTRHPTPYGQRIARRLAEGCARAGVAVISGLAIGIDGAAHLGALDVEGGRTIAVMATGIDRVHPASHRGLAKRVAAAGALVTTYPPGTPVRKHRFLERNGIIAAFCQTLVVVEGVHPSSGALSTVLRAHELGRELLAVPGMITTPQAGAPNTMLRDGCAPCLDVRDVVGAIDYFIANRGQAKPERRIYTTPEVSSLVADGDERRLLSLLEGTTLDAVALADASGLSLEETLDRLLDLELAGFVRRTPLGSYEGPN